MRNFKDMRDKATANCSCTAGGFALGFFGWLGGAIHTANQPGMSGWDGVIWLYYVGRYIAQNFTILHG